MTSPKAFLRLPAQRLVESAKEPDAADKISSTRGIWGLCACQLREGAGWCRAGGGDDRETAVEQIIYFKKKAGLESISQFWEN